MRNFDAFIFDVDGTLASTNELIFSSFKHVVNKYLNKNVTNEDIIALFGPTEDVILKEWMKNDYYSARKDYLDFYANNHHKLANEFEGIVEILQLIKSKNILLAIFTGKGKSTTEITLEKINAAEYFDFIVTGDDVKEHKPSPEGIDLFVNRYNLNKERVILIGDAPADVIAAKKAGIKCGSVLWDSYAKMEVLGMNSDFFFNSIDELKLFVEENI